MPDLKAVVEMPQILQLLASHFTTPIIDLAPVEGGLISRTWSFQAGGEEYIIRFNKDNMLSSNLPKEQYLYQKLAPTGVPIPEILYTGRLGELYYAISRKAAGKMLAQLPLKDVEQLFPQLVEIMDAIHQIDISDTTGYGVFNYQGKSPAKSWRGVLLRVNKEEDDKDFFGKWHHLFEDSFLERPLFEEIYQHMRQLLIFCPEERYLMHGGLSVRNLLAQDGKITAALDWVDAMYGDFVYDIAYLDFWSPSCMCPSVSRPTTSSGRSLYLSMHNGFFATNAT
ncbi:phosphotransferase family protein [Dictyobacter kobayashii]|uniref:Aminoglycoside phosphotransferase domain-containing protein n=1 Tax=Dictyobacter kobayashii TaxID=2014872 RepID=A0A402AYL1_9CHLR|nr:aminoglycoside phosphotransferase family protein [Dictyobacter kobayashii]GCE24184.1 hypothetical protein KDK_79840 [Dictyobacter kobayashii]